MEFTDEKFEQLSCGKTCNTTVTPYKGPTGKEIGEQRVKDVGVIINKKNEFGNYMEKKSH